jgi:hypothetical protein
MLRKFFSLFCNSKLKKECFKCSIRPYGRRTRPSSLGWCLILGASVVRRWRQWSIFCMVVNTIQPRYGPPGSINDIGHSQHTGDYIPNLVLTWKVLILLLQETKRDIVLRHAQLQEPRRTTSLYSGSFCIGYQQDHSPARIPGCIVVFWLAVSPVTDFIGCSPHSPAIHIASSPPLTYSVRKKKCALTKNYAIFQICWNTHS